MESLGNNRYQLLFIDDDASDLCLGQKKLQETGGQPKHKRSKLPNGGDKAKTLILNKKPLQHKLLISKSNGNGHGKGDGLNKFDRHSGSDKTGIKAVVKRNGGGAHNWGSVIKDIEEQSIAMKNPGGENLIEEDDTKYITVEEWRAMRVERAKPIYNIRKAGEGEVNKPDWKKMIVLPKKKPSKTDNDSGLEYDASMYPQRVGRLQRIMDIEFKFKDDRRRSGYLSGWAGGRPLNKSEAESVSDPINMNDEIEFPTLG
nr:plasminogen activator inhibitor 1 RNA-binding protein [Drosophila virilis]